MSKTRIKAVFIFFIIVLFLLVVHLFNISQIKQVSYTQNASDQRRQTKTVKNFRGCIYDMNMIPLVDNSIGENLVDETFVTKTLVRYGKNPLAHHVIGYTMSDGTGGAGIEKAFDSYLASQKNQTVTYMVDARGNPMGNTLLARSATEKIPDTNIKLTLDCKVQKIVEQTCNRLLDKGAVVIMDTESFDVKAMVSRPVFSQNDITKSFESDDSPLFNRALGSYNAGSIFKIITSSAMMKKGLYDYKADCKGVFSVDGKDFLCNKETGHGMTDFMSGFSLSCNTFFYSGSKGLGKEIENTARDFGIGENLLNCDIDESSGYFPMKDYYFPREEANLSIGQGEILITPLQATNMVCIIANGGVKKKVNLADSLVDKEGAIVKNLRNEGSQRVIYEKDALLIKEMMENVVLSGTGTGAKSDIVKISGKTGSAETGWEINSEKMVHAWFCGFFPSDNPKYAMAVFSENGKSGGEVCAPIFREIAEKLAENF
jgi:peptidoglycan glycosyltransferase/penicillin-binding protein 2